jgi:hypothetical protein
MGVGTTIGLSGGTPAPALARSLRAMTLGVLHSYSERVEEREDDALGEIDQQYQLTLSGKASAKAVWQNLDVDFDTPFIDGSDDRDPDFLYPMFTYGTVVTKGSRLVLVCNVTKWRTDGEYVVGCTIEIGVFRPTGGGVGEYKAELHLNFQGWASPNPPEPDIEAEGI